jgi:hypothetical protein
MPSALFLPKSLPVPDILFSYLPTCYAGHGKMRPDAKAKENVDLLKICRFVGI